MLLPPLATILKVDTNQESLTMKRIFLSISVLFFISFSLVAQDSGQKNLGSIAFSYSSFWNNQETRNQHTWGGAGYVDENFYTIGIDYLRSLNAWLEYETGLEYSKQTFRVYPEFPSLGYSKYDIDLSLISVPVTIRANFLNYFFLNGGLLLDLDLNSSSQKRYQSGIGCLFGIATKYDFRFGGSVFINPYLKYHSLISFSSDAVRLKVNETGIRVGLAYNLNRIK